MVLHATNESASTSVSANSRKASGDPTSSSMLTVTSPNPSAFVAASALAIMNSGACVPHPAPIATPILTVAHAPTLATAPALAWILFPVAPAPVLPPAPAPVSTSTSMSSSSSSSMLQRQQLQLRLLLYFQLLAAASASAPTLALALTPTLGSIPALALTSTLSLDPILATSSILQPFLWI